MSSSNMLLPYEISGKKEGATNMTIFLHGWPDSFRLWDGIIKGVEKDTLCLNLTYPNYSDKETITWGQDFPELIERMKATIDFIDNGKNLKKLFVSHDWGCYYAYMLDKKYPGYLSDQIAMDVSPYVNKKLGATLYTIAYQWYNVFTFLVGTLLCQKVANLLLTMILLFFKYPYNTQQVNYKMNFPYYHLWKHIFKNFGNQKKMHLYGYKPSCPIVYIFAQNKPFQFHTDKWLQLLEANNCEKHMVKGGHWIHVRNTTFIIETIIRRLNSILK